MSERTVINKKIFKKVLASVFIAMTAVVMNLGWKPAIARESVKSDSLDVEQRLSKVREYVKISQNKGEKDKKTATRNDNWNDWSNSPSPSPSPKN